MSGQSGQLVGRQRVLGFGLQASWSVNEPDFLSTCLHERPSAVSATQSQARDPGGQKEERGRLWDPGYGRGYDSGEGRAAAADYVPASR